MTPSSAKQIFFHGDSESARMIECITSLDVAPLKASAGGVPESQFVFGDCSGRVYVLDGGLNFVRTASVNFAGATLPTNTTFAERASNQALAGNYAYCAEDHTPADGGGRLYVADYAVRTLRKTTANDKPIYAVYAIERGASGGHSWERFLSPTGVPTTSILEAKNEDSYDLLRPSFNRTLIYRDIDGINGRDLEILAETGVAYLDSASGLVRRFQPRRSTLSGRTGSDRPLT